MLVYFTDVDVLDMNLFVYAERADCDAIFDAFYKLWMQTDRHTSMVRFIGFQVASVMFKPFFRACLAASLENGYESDHPVTVSLLTELDNNQRLVLELYYNNNLSDHDKAYLVIRLAEQGA